MDTTTYNFLQWIPKTLSFTQRYELNELFIQSPHLSSERVDVMLSDQFLSCYGLTVHQMDEFRTRVYAYRKKMKEHDSYQKQ